MEANPQTCTVIDASANVVYTGTEIISFKMTMGDEAWVPVPDYILGISFTDK